MKPRAAALIVAIVILGAAAAIVAIPATKGAPRVGSVALAKESPAQITDTAGSVLTDQVLPDTSASPGKYIAEHVDEFATPEYRKRKALRMEFQRTGYVNTLHDVLAFDALGALLSYIRARLQIEYSLPHNTIYFRDDLEKSWALPEDWTFPEDPWSQ
jgi:hypothetical protein